MPPTTRSRAKKASSRPQPGVPDSEAWAENLEQKGDKIVTKTQTPARKRKGRPGLSLDNVENLSANAKEIELPAGSELIGSRKNFTLEIPLPSSSTKLPRSEEIMDSGEEGSDDEAQFKTPLENKRIVYDDEEHEEFVTPMEAPLRHPLHSVLDSDKEEDEEEDEESDDDAPPEAISSHAAKAQNVKSTESAVKALEKQEDAKKKKRKDRDAFYTQQARSRRGTKGTAAETEPLAAAEHGGAPEAAAESEPPRKRKLDAPGLLPPELLESDDEDEDLLREQLGAPKPKKTKLDVTERLTMHEARPPQDQRVGSTVYRIMGDGANSKLAPKATKESWQLRQKLLARHRIPGKKGGFLVKKR